MIQTRQGGALTIRYPGVSGAWLDSGLTVPSGTVGLAVQESSGPFTLESGATVSGFVQMEWPDALESVGVASGWVAEDYTTIVACSGSLVAKVKAESPLYSDPKGGSILPLVTALTLGYLILFSD